MLVAVVAVMVGCRGAQKVQTQSYPVRGKVVSLETASQEVLLDHEAIPGLMEAMEMQYRVMDPAVMTEVHPGDRISATLLVDRDSVGPKNMRLKDVVVIAQARPDYKPAVQYHQPTAGEEVPDFKLLNQFGKTIDLKQFRGKVVALTFIYTRCPLSDFCPRYEQELCGDRCCAGEGPCAVCQDAPAEREL